jgi:hypothetical protein
MNGQQLMTDTSNVTKGLQGTDGNRQEDQNGVLSNANEADSWNDEMSGNE